MGVRSSRFGSDLTALAGAAALLAAGPSRAGDPGSGTELPEEIHVTGVVRDFIERTEPDGHPDFENRPSNGFGRYAGNVSVVMGEHRKPVFTGNGRKVAREWRDARHRQICHLLYDPSLGDHDGLWSRPDTGGITSAGSFAQWYTDEPGVNLSAPLTLTLVLQPNGHYVFDDRMDPVYRELGGFFPIDDQLFGNSGGRPDHNFHFTFELHMEFEYQADGEQFFQFIGDDDVWVFINERLCIDLGGVHAAHDQYVAMDRLGLSDGEAYTIDFFFAERFRPYSSFRIETNIPVRVAELPTMTAAYD